MAAGFFLSRKSVDSPVQLLSRPNETTLRPMCAAFRWRLLTAAKWITSVHANRSSRVTRPKCALQAADGLARNVRAVSGGGICTWEEGGLALLLE